MKILADDNIPLVNEYFGKDNEIVLKPGRNISAIDLEDTDILLVRSVTKVDQHLLENSPVKFVGSATTGSDHIDLAYLNQKNIPYGIATGCNTDAVVDYVLRVISVVEKNLISKKAAVIGIGRIGSQISAKLKSFGFDVVECDPLRAENESDFISTALENINDVDLITLHTPLTKEGKFPTYHMIEKNFLKRQKPGCVLINTSRGSVIHSGDLKIYGTHLQWCLDVWENEPDIDLEILQKALIATPHIAGYSVQSKLRGIEMIYEEAVKRNLIHPVDVLTRISGSEFCHASESWHPVLVEAPLDASFRWHDTFDPMQTTEALKNALIHQTDTFDNLRKKMSCRVSSINIKHCGVKSELSTP